MLNNKYPENMQGSTLLDSQVDDAGDSDALSGMNEVLDQVTGTDEPEFFKGEVIGLEP
jgi:hypothetical protein